MGDLCCALKGVLDRRGVDGAMIAPRQALFPGWQIVDLHLADKQTSLVTMRVVEHDPRDRGPWQYAVEQLLREIEHGAD